MIKEPTIMACLGDLAGAVRGKGFPYAELQNRIREGVGWTPTNVQITCFDTIAESPYGAIGDLVLWPAAETEVAVAFDSETPDERFILCDAKFADGRTWEFCLRSILKEALAVLRQETGLSLLAVFEHEFTVKADRAKTQAFSLSGFRQQKTFGETFVAALRQGGLTPDTFLREFGQNQYEVTIAPAFGVAAADQAVILRELARATALHHSEPITFSPIVDPAGVGNGVHIHMSFHDEKGGPAAYDGSTDSGLTATAGSFIAGILKYLNDIVALTAPSVVSYWRLVPHKWSAAFNNLGDRDREASVRICRPRASDEAVAARQFNFEFRAADAAANPHLQLAALVLAGLQGIRERLPTPAATNEDISLLTPEELARRGMERLPTSLTEALDRLARSSAVRGWLPTGFVDLYLAHKRAEVAFLHDRSDAEICDAYASAY